MSTALYIIGFVIGGLATIVTLVFTIISLATHKNKKAINWTVGFVISVSIMTVSLIQVMKRLAEKVKTGIEFIEGQKNKSLLDKSCDDDWAMQERLYFLDTLKKYTNENVKSKVPVDYYEDKPAGQAGDSSIVLPFVYPFSMKISTVNFLGEIINEVNDSVFLSNISEMAFDENFVIAVIDNSNDSPLLKSGRAEVEYILFDLRTHEFIGFASEKDLDGKARKIGYAGSDKMKFLSEIYQGWLQ